MVMTAWTGLLVTCFFGAQSHAGEINPSLRNTHGSVEGLSHQLSDALDHLSQGLGERPRAPQQDPTVKMILKALNELPTNSQSDPSENFESLKRKEASLRKELHEIVNEWIKNDSKPESEKSTAVERALVNEREIVREKTKNVQKKIKSKIDEVMHHWGYVPKQPGSSTYEKGESLLSVRFDSGEIVVSPIKLLPPVEN